MQMGKYNTFSYGSEGKDLLSTDSDELQYSTLSHGSERSFSVSLVANSFDDYIN